MILRLREKPNTVLFHSLAFFCLNFILSSISYQVCSPTVLGESKSNFLFIAIDDLKDRVGCMGRHPQSLIPNSDRLAAYGVLFENTHCPVSACNPSLTAIFTGISPQVSGLFRNEQNKKGAFWRKCRQGVWRPFAPRACFSNVEW